MSVQALVCRINVQPIVGADYINRGVCAGAVVVVGKSITDGSLGVYFPPDGQVSELMAFHNNLYRSGKGTNADFTASGYLDSNRRVRAIKLKGVYSEGIFLSRECLAWTGIDVEALTEGMTFNDLKGHKVFDKYMTEATKLQREKIKSGNTVDNKLSFDFPKHYDTANIRDKVLATDSFKIITTKLHGTSGRTGNVLVTEELPAWKTWLNKFGFGFKPRSYYKHISGTRNCIVNTDITGEYASEKMKNFRRQVHASIALAEGECVYYEIVGFETSGAAIQKGHVFDKSDPVYKEVTNKYGSACVNWAYGCAPGTYDVYVYRITHTYGGHEIELDWHQLEARCARLGLKHVPVLHKSYGVSHDEIKEIAKQYAEAPDDTFGGLREGVCVRSENAHGINVVKYKTWLFAYIEGHLKDVSNYVDIEEAS